MWSHVKYLFAKYGIFECKKQRTVYTDFEESTADLL